MTRLLPLLVLAAACSRTPKSTPGPPDAGPRRAAAPPPSAPPSGPPPLSKGDVVTLMESLALLHAEHMKDCARLTSELEAFEKTRAGELVRAAPAAYGEIEADPPLALRLDRAMETIMTVSMACSNHPGFVALHARRQGKPPPQAPASAAPSSPPRSPAPAPSR